MVKSKDLNRSLGINLQGPTPNITKVKERKATDPLYIPPKNEEGVHAADFKPKRTPRKRKVAPSNASSSKDLTSPAQTSKRQNLGQKTDEVAQILPDHIDNKAENVRVVVANADIWHHLDVLSESNLSVLVPGSDILNVTHDSQRSLSKLDKSPLSPWTTYSGNTAEVDSGKFSSPLEEVVARKRTQSASTTAPFTPHVSDEAESDDATFRVSQNEKSAVVFDFSVEKARRWADAINVPGGFYNEEEQDLFFRLAMRGFEPLMPSGWRPDFPTLPSTLFSDSESNSVPLIQAFKRPETYATKSLSSLFSLGGRVRDCKISRKRPGILIKNAIKQYIRWALYDTDLQTKTDTIPVHAIYAQRKGENTLNAVKKLNRRLQSLSSRYRKALSVAATNEDHGSTSPRANGEDGRFAVLRPVYPLLIGFIICGPIVAILTLGTDPPSTSGDGDSKLISQFDLEEMGHDVWNSLAVAVTIMKIRRTATQLANKGLGGFVRLSHGDKSATDMDI
ncbi:hypothetical protein BDV29DRAFT_184539 [Aspergillus leporis]|uniref:Uncharacterized protein n=1 Tax=Aspergillus leporis TaxID=41062 RepID=A0A5N5WKW6_9EURO|nr:hypothetical protein BDV29DRAFT_184539 [Aspergillus leporis]